MTRAIIVATIDDAEHFTPEQRAEIARAIPNTNGRLASAVFLVSAPARSF